MAAIVARFGLALPVEMFAGELDGTDCDDPMEHGCHFLVLNCKHLRNYFMLSPELFNKNFYIQTNGRVRGSTQKHYPCIYLGIKFRKPSNLTESCMSGMVMPLFVMENLQFVQHINFYKMYHVIYPFYMGHKTKHDLENIANHRSTMKLSKAQFSIAAHTQSHNTNNFEQCITPTFLKASTPASINQTNSNIQSYRQAKSWTRHTLATTFPQLHSHLMYFLPSTSSCTRVCNINACCCFG